MIYNSFGILQNCEEIWMIKFEELKKYIDENSKRPSEHNKDKQISFLGRWIQIQQRAYKKQEYIMKNKNIYNKWTEFINDPIYKVYFQSNKDNWIYILNQVKLYFDTYNKRPSLMENKKLCYWIYSQKAIYKNKKCIMLDEEIYNQWTEFINNDKYKIYFQSNEEIWIDILIEVKKYINDNNKRPPQHNDDIKIKKIANWIGKQQQTYIKKTEIMSNKNIYNKWTEFINDDKYKIYFQSNEHKWFDILIKLKKYIDENNKRPSEHNKDKQISFLGRWICNQQNNYKNKEQIMKNEEIYNQWTEFINNPVYKVYFQSNEDNWIDILIEVKKYINDNNKRPPQHNDDIKIKKIANWITTQIENYNNKKQIMKNEEIYNQWTEFINDPIYKVYFQSNEDNWIDLLNQVKLYIDINNKRPSNNSKDFKINIGTWITTQIENYNNKKQIMKNKEIYNQWTKFINDPIYKKYF